MCGVYAYVGKSPTGRLGARVHATQLSRASYLAGTRGPHAHGWAEPHPDGGVWRCVRRLGSSMDDADTATTASALLVGHSRLGTGHNPFVADEAQPIVVGRVALAHNGVVHHLTGLDSSLVGRRRTGTDSEVIAHAVADALSAGARLDDAVDDAWAACRLDSPTALLVADIESGMLAARRGGTPRPQPLWVRSSSVGTYLCSRPMDGSRLLPEGVTLTWRGDVGWP